MKRILTILVVMAVVAAAGSVYAAGNATINVSATVNGICKFSSASASLAFGALDPDAGADAPGSGSIQFWCTKGVGAPAFTINGGAYILGTVRQMLGSTFGENLDYSIDTVTPDALSNAGPASPRTLTIAGKVYVGGLNGFSVVSADTYNDSVTITVTP